MTQSLYFFKRNKLEQGFTLVEVLVALFILSLAITAISSLIVTNDQTAVSIRNNYIASGLVQEGFEVVRNLRDGDALAGNSFGNTIPDGNFVAQWNSTSLTSVVPGNQPVLNLSQNNGLYSYDVGNPTIFKRLITISTPQANIEKKVTVTVTWQEHNRNLSTTAETHLYNWPNP